MLSANQIVRITSDFKMDVIKRKKTYALETQYLWWENFYEQHLSGRKTKEFFKKQDVKQTREKKELKKSRLQYTDTHTSLR